jgi:hypothetical protein
MLTFETIRAEVMQLTNARSNDTRKPWWCTSTRRIGVARDSVGRLELFLVAEQLEARSAVVNQNMVRNIWNNEDGGCFAATRLVLPPDLHFVGVVSLILEELIRNRFEREPQGAFRRSEPLIELALLRLGIGVQSVIGLLGELSFLKHVLVHVPEGAERYAALDTWRGFEHSARDFVGRKADVEVKATTLINSVHHIANLQQISSAVRMDSPEPSKLYLLSVGFKASTNAGQSLCEQVDSVLGLLEPGASQEQSAGMKAEFLRSVARYGTTPSGSGSGYDHATMQEWPLYATRWEQTFARLYDMSDSSIRLPRLGDWANFDHVVLDSISFQIRLPDRVSGDINPTDDFHAAIDELVR